ncbi:MAG: EAL domain-containing protein [Ketobacter sp.]|nr:MAG: EAL domain-containing protein [Ketobacter sp.]
MGVALLMDPCVWRRLLLALLIAWASHSSALTSISVQLKWQHQFQFAGFYAAQQQGFYRNAGLDVTLLSAGPGLNPIDQVLSGQADYGLANSELLLYHLNGSPVTALAVIFQHSPLVLLSLKQSEINRPQDLIGKRVMFASGPYGANTQGLLLRQGVGMDQVTHVPLSFNPQDLLEGRVDAMVGYITSLPYWLQQQGASINVIDPRSHGIDFYGDTLFTLRDRVVERPEEVRLFREATLRGWRYALEHPDEVIDLLVTQYGYKNSRAALQFEAEATRKLIMPKLVELGHMNPGRWHDIGKTFSDLGLGPQTVNLEGFLYDPAREELGRNLRMVAWLVSGLLFAVMLVSVLIGFNRRLTRRLREHTRNLRESHDVLKEKELALSQLNQELEQKIAIRTDALERTNEELKLEIAERHQRELSLRLLSKAVENSHSGILIADGDLSVVYVNPAFLRLTGLELQAVSRSTLKNIRDRFPLPWSESSELQSQSGVPVHEDVVCNLPDGRRRFLQVSVVPIRNSGEGAGNVLQQSANGVTHFLFNCEDVTLLKESRDEMEKLAFYDQLTGLESRLLFKLRLENALGRSSRDGRMTALMFIDLDLFKQINDHYGHDVGDEVLKQVASRIRVAVRSNDTVARISGDEFTVIVSDITDHGVARRVAEDIRSALSTPVVIAGVEHRVSVSIGIAITPSDATNAETLIKHADVAMYQAKSNGRNDIQFFSQSMNEWVKEKKQLEQDMRVALSEHQFQLVYQPVIDLNTNRLEGLEALMRWQHPTRGHISPEYFIPLAEESGLILPIGKWLAQELVSAMGQITLLRMSAPLISINVSAKQIRNESLMRDMRKILKGGDLGRGAVLLELTEEALRSSSRGERFNVQQVNDLGIRFVLDEFGEGGVPLRVLKNLPIDFIKISRNFVDECLYDQTSAQAIVAIIALAKSLGIRAVAVGVETMEQARFLREKGCDLAQGHLFAPASPLDELLKHFATGNVVTIRSIG